MQHLEGLTTYPERLSCEFLSLSLSLSPMVTPRCTAAVFRYQNLERPRRVRYQHHVREHEWSGVVST